MYSKRFRPSIHGLKMAIFAAFLIGSVAMASECEQRLEAPVGSLLAIIEQGLNKRAVTPERLAEVFKAGAWGNPFVAANGLVGAPFYRAFASWSEILTAQQKHDFRVKLDARLAEFMRETKRSEKAKEETRALIHPMIVNRAEEVKLAPNNYDLVWIEGRPVLVGSAEENKRNYIVLYDPLNPDQQARVRRISKGWQATVHKIFYSRGSAYLFSGKYDDLRVYDLQTGKNVTRKFKIDSRLNNRDSYANIEVVHTDSEVFLVASVTEYEELFIYKVSLTDTSAPATLLYSGKDKEKPKYGVDDIGDAEILHVQFPDKIIIYDFARHWSKRIKPRGEESLFYSPLVVYRGSKGRLMLATSYLYNKFAVGLSLIDTSSLERRLVTKDFRGKFSVHSVNGIPRILEHKDGYELNTADLSVRQLKWVDFGIKPVIFQSEGDTYILVDGPEDLELLLLSDDTPKQIAKFPNAGRASNLIGFEYDGNEYAFATTANGPILIRVFNSPDSN